MKKLNIAYWIVTGLFSLIMIASSFGNVISDKQSIEIIVNGLGFPAYMLPFLGIAKISGGIVVLIPGLKRIKEWAYAGIFFDLTGATFAIIAKNGFQPSVTFMLVFYILLFGSYFLWHKKEAADVIENF